MNTPAFNQAARVMLIAPHPDDETLAAGVLLQKAVAAAASIRVVYATDGENNPWPQRVLERKWKLSARDQKRWGKLRRREALAALEQLGLRRTDARFLGLPDLGLTDLVLRNSAPVLKRLASFISDWQPTHLFFPSLDDTHPDHSALGVLARMALFRLPERDAPASWQYLVHGHHRLFAAEAIALPQSRTEQNVKSAAIECHVTQTSLSRRRFLGYARRPEFFQAVNVGSLRPAHPIATLDPTATSLNLRLPRRSIATARRTILYLIGRDQHGNLFPLLALPLSDCARSRGIPGKAGQWIHLAFPVQDFVGMAPLFLKLERRRWFFDREGWLEIELPQKSRVRIGSEQVEIAA